MSFAWNDESPNVVVFPDGTSYELQAGISAEEAHRYFESIGAYESHGKSVSGEDDAEERSGFVPGIFSSIENIKGTFGSALPFTAAGLPITGTEEQRLEYLKKGQEISSKSREAQMEELPDPASVESIKEAYDDGGAWDALSETWDFAKESVGQQVPIFGGLMAAQKVGASKLVSNSLIGRAGTALLARAVPAAVAPYVAASFTNPWTGAAAALALSAAFAYSSMLRDNAETAEDLEDIKVLRAATAAAPHAAMEYLGFAMTGAFGPIKQKLAAKTLKDTLAGASTSAGREAWKASGKQVAKSLTEFPTELAQTVIERAQAGESISLDDADFVMEMINVAAATAPVVGVFGGYGGYRSYKNEKATGQEFEKKTKLEKAHRNAVSEARRLKIEEQEANARRIADEATARYESAVGAERAMDERIVQEVEKLAERTPVEYEDILEALDSRGVTPDNVFNSGVAAFIFRNTDGNVKSLDQLKDSPALSQKERDQRAKYRRRVYSILSGMGSFEYVGADKDSSLTFSEYTSEQFDKVIKATRKFKGKGRNTKINRDNIRKILGFGNSGIENRIAGAIKRDLKLDGYSQRVNNVDVGRNPGHTEAQYREIMDLARSNGRLTQEIYEQVTNNYGREPYSQFVEDALVRGGLDPAEAENNVYVPMRAEKGIGFIDVQIDPDATGFFIRDEDGKIVGGASTKSMANDVLRVLKHRSRSYTVKRNGQTYKTFKSKGWADQVVSKESQMNPEDSFEVVSNPVAKLEIDKTKSPGFRVVEQFRDEDGNPKDTYEDSFSPTIEIAEERKVEREREYSVGESSWDRRSDKRREQAMQDLLYGPKERGYWMPGVPYVKPVLEDYAPAEPVLSEEETRIVEAIDSQLEAIGITDFKGKVEKSIAAGENTDALGQINLLYRTISVALDKVSGADTDAELDSAVASVVDHEVIHAMRELDLFEDSEWLALTRSIARIRIPDSVRNQNPELFDDKTTFLQWAETVYGETERAKSLKLRKNPDEYWDYITEEAVAELHSAYKNNPEVFEQVSGETKSLLDRFKGFLERVYNSITGIGYKDASSVFADIGKGTIGARKRGEIRTIKPGQKYGTVQSLTQPETVTGVRASDTQETRGGSPINLETETEKKSLRAIPRKFNSSVQINGDWSELILSGQKTVETSGQSMVKNGGAPGWVLLRDESGNASGAAKFGRRFEYKSKEDFDKDFDRHKVPVSSSFSFGKRNKTYGYPVEEFVRFEQPVQVKTPAGQNRKKNLTSPVVPLLSAEAEVLIPPNVIKNLEEVREGTTESEPYFVQRVNSGPESNLDIRPEISNRQELKQRSIDIANDVIEPVKFSLFDRKNLNPENKRSAGTSSYEESKARVVPASENLTFFERFMKVLEERGFSYFRQKFIDKYDAINKLSKKAGEKRRLSGDDQMLLANVSAASAAYMSDSVQGVVSESITSGQPVYSGGIVRVDYEKPGLFEILKDVYQQGYIQDFHFWLLSRRSSRIDKDTGKLVPVSPEQIAEVESFLQARPELKDLFERTNEQYQQWNENLVDFLRDTGVVDEGLGEVFKSYGDYVPFYRQYEGEAHEEQSRALSELVGQSVEELQNTIDPQTGRPIVGRGPVSVDAATPSSLFGSLVGVRPPKRLKGGDSMVVPMLEGVMKNLQAAISSGSKNVAAQRTMRDAVLVGDARKIDKKSDAEYISDVVTIRVNGRDEFYEVNDMLLYDSISGMMEGKIPYMSFFSGPSNLLRELVTRSPDFIFANLLRDSISTWTTSGSNMTPLVGTMKNFFKGGISMSGNVDPSLRALTGSGVVGGYDNSRYPKDLQKSFDKRMREEGLTVSGKKRGLRDNSLFNSMNKIWDWSGDVTTKSDAATRIAVYEDVYKNLLNKGHSQEEAEAEAIFQAKEVINFSRRGNSTLARIVTTAIPFLNARVQGLDVLWRAARGQYASDYSKIGQKNSVKSFLFRGGLLATLTGMYALAAHDEEEWKAASPAEQDDNWIFPGIGSLPGFKIPIPFEIGIIFKVIPERIMRALSGETDSRQAANAIMRGITSSLKMNPFEAQATKPILEVIANHSFFTGQPIVPIYLEDRLPEFQRFDGSNALAVSISENFGGSPIEIEHILKGYTGTVGTWMLFVMDDMIRNMTNMPARPSFRADQWPMLKRFLQTDLGSEGQLSNFYDLRSEVRKFSNSFRDALEVGNVEKAREIYERYPALEGIKKELQKMDNELSQLRNYKSNVFLSRMDEDEKLKIINNIDARRKVVTAKVGKLREYMDLPAFGNF